jgi:hypothetical protein
MAINIPILLLIIFVIVFSQPAATTFCDYNHKYIIEFRLQYNIHFKIIGTVIINLIKQAPHNTFSSAIKTTEFQLKPEIIFCNYLPGNLQSHEKTRIYAIREKY